MDQKSLVEIQKVLDALPPQFKAELKELEGHLAALDRVVKKIVHAYFDGFTQSNKSYSQIIHHVSEAQERVSGLLADMDKVQKNMQDHSHEVSALTRQKRQTEQMIRLLDKMYAAALPRVNWSSAFLRSVPTKFQQLVAKKDYLEAAKLVSTAMGQLVREDVLAVGTGLVDLIQANFFELMLEELRQVIYGSQYSFESEAGSQAEMIDSDGLDVVVKEDDDGVTTDAQKFVRTLLESLQCVGQLQDASLFLFEQVRPALKAIVDKEMADIVQSRRYAGGILSARKNQATPLSELLDQVLGRFRHVLTAHYVVTTELQSFGNKAEGDGREQWREAYSANAVWSVIEDVTQVRRGVCSVTDEFTGAIERSPPELGDATPVTATGAPAHRRRLFSFAASSAAFEYVEQDDASFFQAQPSNIVLIYPQVLAFHKDALRLLLKSQNNQRPDASSFRLREYLDTFVRSSFLPYVGEYHRNQAARSIEGGDAFKVRERGPPVPYKETSRPLVLAVLAAEESLRELVEAIAAIPSCAIEFMQIAEQSITRLLTRATTKSNEVMQGTEAAKFIKVEANVSKMTADPAFRSLKRQPLTLGTSSNSVLRYDSGDLGDYEEEDTRASIWSSWFTMPVPPPPDASRLQHLSATSDSLEWLADRIDAEFADKHDHIRAEQLRHLQRGAAGQVLAASAFSLEPLTLKLRALGDRLLLMLRLEVGSMCFHYLGSLKQHNYAPDVQASAEPDPSVTELCTQLRQCNELLTVNLPLNKRRYVLEPLPRLCCTLLVHILSDIPRVNSNGVTLMSRNVFALQQAMASLGNAREELFDRVRRYYELLNQTEEDVLAGIGSTMSRSELFTLKEYRRVLELSGGGVKRVSERVLQKLQELLR